jgi:hypothetical protein
MHVRTELLTDHIVHSSGRRPFNMHVSFSACCQYLLSQLQRPSALIAWKHPARLDKLPHDFLCDDTGQVMVAVRHLYLSECHHHCC